MRRCVGVLINNRRIAAISLGATLQLSKSFKSSCEHLDVNLKLPYIVSDSSTPAHQYTKKSRANTLIEAIDDAFTQTRRMLIYCQRILQYILYGIPVAVLVPVAYLCQDIYPVTEERLWSYIIWTIEMLGPTFIKFAQWASTRPDLYPPQLIEKLQRLQDDVTVRHSKATVENTLRESFGEDWKSKIELDTNEPLGAGCIAQVFKGVLHDGHYASQPVAVKLIHPGVERLVKVDMELLTIIANLMDRIPTLELLSFGDTCREFAKIMTDQLDMRIEASNLMKFKQKWANVSWGSFPTPLEPYVTKNVLVETLMEGRPLKEFMQQSDSAGKGTKAMKKKLSDLGCWSVIKMIFDDNFVHGDLHPGNMLVQIAPDGSPILVFLDCGIVFSAKSEADHRKLSEICFAFMRHDGITAGELMIDRNPDRYKHLSPTEYQHNKEAFCRGLQKMIDDSKNELFFEHFYKYVNRICELARKSSIKLDPSYFEVAMALKIVEGVSLSLNKDLDMITKCIPLVAQVQALKKLGLSNKITYDESSK